MNNSAVQSLWISNDGNIPQLQRLCLESFLKNNTVFYLYTYRELKGLPDGVVLMDANPIIPEKFVFRDLYNSYATFADWFRLKLLYSKGGWWVDTDIVCLKEFVTADDFIFATELSNGNPVVCNCVMKLPKNAPMLKPILYSVEQKLAEKDFENIKWREIGAIALIDGIVNFSLMEYMVSPEVFCPIDYANYNCIAHSGDIVVSPGTYGVHLWNQMWLRNNIDPSALINSASFVRRFVVAQ